VKLTMTRDDYNIAMAVIALLAERYPNCFHVYEVRRRPLKVGIDKDIIARAGDTITPDAVSNALSVYVKNKSYLRHMQVGAPRIDLDGQPVGVVSERDALGADGILRKRLERLAARLQQEEAQRKQEAAAKAPKRISLADLKRTALERKRNAA
jgi:ProP effector